MNENTFQEQLNEFFGGSTGTTLGPEVQQSYLQGSYANRFNLAKTSATQFRGVQLACDSSNVAYIDFNSLDGGTNDYDTRIISVGGEAGVPGRGIIGMNANEYHLNGNTAEAEPEYRFPGYLQQPAIPFNTGVNQGRLFALRNYQWSGSGGNNGASPVVTIQLRDPVSLTPWFGVFDVYMSSGFSGGGVTRWVSTNGWVIGKNADPPTGIIEGRNSEGGALAVIYAEADWNIGGFPQIKLFNKQAGTSFIYIVKATVFPDNDGF